MSAESDPPYEMTLHSVPMADTGIGREMGYANDAEFIAAAEAARADLSPAARAFADAMDAKLAEAFLGKERA